MEYIFRKFADILADLTHFAANQIIDVTSLC